MFAVEICTENQYKRLTNNFLQFEKLKGRPRADIYLILVECPEDAFHQRILDWTQKLVKGMYGKKSLAPLIRRVACLDASLERNVGLSVRCRFVFGEGVGH